VALFAVGILFGRSFADRPEFFALLAVPLFVVLVVAGVGRVWPCVAQSILPSLLCVLLGCLGVAVDSHRVHSIPDSLLGRDVILVGVVVDHPRLQGERLKIVVEGEFLRHDSTYLPLYDKVLVSMKFSNRAEALRHGSVVLLKGAISRPASARNPGEFDQRRYYEANGIQWMCTAKGDSAPLEVGRHEGYWIINEIILPVRRYLLSEIERSIGGQEGEYLKGVLIGERGGLSPAVRAAFTSAGVAHILAVSGGNVAVVVAFVFLAAELFRIQRKLRPAVACAGVIFYMLLVGYQPPVVRATIMALILLIGMMMGEKANPINALGVSALVILGFDSRQLFDIGFQLSFLAVLSIIYLHPLADAALRKLLPGMGPLSRSLLWLLRVCSVSLAATFGTLPLTATSFGMLSVIGVFANIAVVPASGISLLLGFVALPLSIVNPWIASMFNELNRLVLHYTLELTLMAGNLPFSSLETLTFMTVDALPFYAILLLVYHLHDRRITKKMCLVVLLALDVWMFWPTDVSVAAAHGLRVSFIDVGQGDAVLVEFPDRQTVLIDAGPRARGFDSGERTVVPFLKRRGIEAIDLIVVTHPHNDHIGGIPAVLEEFDVRQVVDCGRSAESTVFRMYKDLVVKEGSHHLVTSAGSILSISSHARLYVLGPEKGPRTGSNPNNDSVVLKLVYGSVSFLFTGDAEEESEASLISRYGDFLRSSLLKVGHHGSITSSTPSFISLVDPALAVVSVGTPNRYRHPSSEVLERFAAHNAILMRTDEEGAIIFETDGATIERIQWKND